MVQRTFRPGKHWLLLLLCLVLCPAGGCKQGAWSLWDAYVAHFIDAQGRVIDHTSGDRTTSEGEAYAMFFALADDDRATFDRLLSWTQGQSRQQRSGKPSSRVALGPRATTDNGRRSIPIRQRTPMYGWPTRFLKPAACGMSPRYANIGRRMMAQIAKVEVTNLPGFGLVLMPGPVGWQHGQTWTLNPSYMPVFVFERLAKCRPVGTVAADRPGSSAAS